MQLPPSFNLLVLVSAIAAAAAPCLGTLVNTTGPDLVYHGGPLLSTKPVLDVYLYWYGEFSKPQRRILLDFFASIKQGNAPAAAAAPQGPQTATPPSVSTWWSTLTLYKDKRNMSVSPSVKLAGQVSDRKYSMGKQITNEDLEAMAAKAINMLAAKFDPYGIYVLITSEDVVVQDFCESQCATHGIVRMRKKAVPFMWVGNSASQCPGQCAWPFALPQYMDYSSTETALKAPNDVGMDGVVINIASILAGAATNPQGNAYYEGNPSVPLEAATACAGIFGPNAYPGAPGDLLTDSTGASFNAVGANSRRFLLPCLWHPLLRKCHPLAS